MEKKVTILHKSSTESIGYDLMGKCYSIPESAKEMREPFYVLVDDDIITRHTIMLDEDMEYTIGMPTATEAFQYIEEFQEYYVNRERNKFFSRLK